MLEVDGYNVEIASSGVEALEKVGNGDKPDFIILDVLMPELNGLETLKKLMQIDRGLNVIMLSCSNEIGTVVEAIRLGAHDYLTKPFEKAELEAAILKCQQKRKLKRRKPVNEGVLRPDYRGFVFPDGEPADGSDSAADSADRAGGCPCVHLRRKRRGKRSSREDDSLAIEPAQLSHLSK